MFKSFKRVSGFMPPEEIITSHLPPFEGFKIPPIVHTFYRHMEEQQAARGYEVTGGFVFGGMFASIHRGDRPKDYDVYVSSPALLKDLRDNANMSARSYKEAEERSERLYDLIGFDFPISIACVNVDLARSDLLGDYITVMGVYGDDKESAFFDVKVGSKTLPVEQFACFTGAPIMSVGATLGGEGAPYAYHANYVEQTKHKVLCHSQPNYSLQEFAKRKGWSVMTPDEWEQCSASNTKPEGEKPVTAVPLMQPA